MTVGLLPFRAPDAEEARRLLEQELTKPAYVEAQPNIAERLLGEFLRAVVRFLDGLGGLGAGPGTLVLVIGALLVVVVAIVLVRPRLNARGKGQEADVFAGDTRYSAAQHRERATAAAAVSDWNTAVAELLRAIIRDAEERVVVAEQAGRTATEAAVQLGGVFPSLVSEVTWLADVFNETHYGNGSASEADYRRAATIDGRLSSERPAPAGGSAAPAAPR